MKRKINLTPGLIIEAIEYVLASYKYSVYCQFLDICKSKWKLITYVIKQACICYTVIIDDARKPSIISKCISSEQYLQITEIVQKSIFYIVQEFSDRNS